MIDEDFSTPDSMHGVAPGRGGTDPRVVTPPGDWGEPPAQWALPPPSSVKPFGDNFEPEPIPTRPYLLTQPVYEDINWIAPVIAAGAIGWAAAYYLMQNNPLPPTPDPPAPIVPMGEMFGNPAFTPAAPLPGVPSDGDGA